jgi:probable phosphoglycerate mutase
MTATRLCIVRHGETAWNAEHRVQGQLDVPLNALGLAQAQGVARALKDEPFAAIYSSDLTRARQTAEPLARARGAAPLLDRDLRERHYGVFERLTYAEVKVKFPEDYARFDARDPDFAFRTGEALRDFFARSVAALTRIAERHPGESLLVFTHGGVLDMLYRHARGVALSAPRDFGIPNAGLNRLEFDGGRWAIREWAVVAHLDGALDDF